MSLVPNSLRRRLPTVGASLILLAFAACDGQSPTSSTLTLAGTDVLVGGESVVGGSFPAGHGAGQTSIFRTFLLHGTGTAKFHTVQVHFQRPKPGGGTEEGSFFLYDDGTRGDRTAMDGVYAFEDLEGVYGCQGADAVPGEYQYDFQGRDPAGNESDVVSVVVTLTL